MICSTSYYIPENEDMPLSQEHKKRSRKRMLDSAVELFTARGFHNVSIDDVMNNAKMTRGAFYAHFSSKSELYKESILNAAVNSNLAKEKPESIGNRQWINRLLNEYLSNDHINQKSAPCPIAFLSFDATVEDPGVRDAYTTTFKNMNKRISNFTKSYSTCSENQILAVTAMIVGGVAIARTLNDNTTKNKLLKSCREISKQILDGI